MKTIDDLSLSGKKALIRVDFNVPLDANLKVSDDTRIKAALPSINKVIASGGSVILMSHLGRPKDSYEEKFSLKHILGRLEMLLNKTVFFSNDCIGEKTQELASKLKPGEILLLENLRFHKEEKSGNREFAGKLAALADVYINDAFGTAHRAHASTTIVADFFPKEKAFGYLINSELKSMNQVLGAHEKPFTAIMGGAKVSDKILIIENLLDKVDNLIIGGGMAYTFVKAQGGSIGSSIVETDKLDLAVKILTKAREKNVKVFLPDDDVVADRFDDNANKSVSSAGDIPEGWMGLDIGPKTIKVYTGVIQNSKTILWNGPMGVFEMNSYQEGTKQIAIAIAEATSKGAFSLIGGGDSVAAINKYKLKDRVSYVSTGGGAMLEYMEGKILPGIKAIEN
ncbi:MAG: phosphoglycerate kinase [Bacteroidota bacterium]|nr:phosphoglycerate kinase [Bacteroidota bacterium]